MSNIYFSVFRKIFKIGMMRSALAVRILNSIRILRRTYLSSYLILGVLFSSYLFWSFGTRVDLSSYWLLTQPLFVFLCCASSMEPDAENVDWIEKIVGDGPRVAAYLRVSTSKQVKGQSLEVQRELINKMKETYKPNIIYGFIDPGKSGKDFDKRKTKAILEFAEKKLIDELWITQVDRLGRECKKLLLLCLNLCEEGVTIRTPEREYDLKDVSSVLMLTIEAHRAEAENTTRAERATASKARLFKLKKWNKPIPLGYRQEGTWIQKIQEWNQFVKDAYSKLVERKALEPVRKFINTKYHRLLPNPLTRSQIRRLLSDLVYAGQPKYLGEVVNDDSLAFIDTKTFAESQKILERILSKHKPKRQDPVKKLIEKHGISALDFLDEIDFIHKDCGGFIRKNGTRTYNGIIRQIYECKKCSRQWIVPSNSQLKKIQTQIIGQEPKSKADESTKDIPTNPLVFVTPSLLTKNNGVKRIRKKHKKKKSEKEKDYVERRSRQYRLDENRFG